jgi:glycosyltransferase involved in cell wall biosynthesis
MQAHVKTIVPTKNVEMVSNMADTSVVLPTQPTDKCVVAYFGTIGYANHLEYLIDIAKEAQTQQQNALEFWIVGKGARMEAVKSLAQAYNLSNIHFFEHQSTEDLQVMMQKVQAVYVSFLAHPVLATTSPNKFFEALAHSKLCVVNVEGWLRELVEQNMCGFYASPTEPQDFLNQMKPFLQNPALLVQYQQNARLLAEREFSTEILTAKILACLS